jgi:hypothetical protein
LVMWDPIPDFLAYRTLASRGEITFAEWARQIIRADITPIYNLRDPMPCIHYLATTAATAGRILLRRALGPLRRASEPASSIVPIKS